jgi:molecular chaperone DnaK (HSP70)
MAEKLMLIVPADLVGKIDANRGDLSQADFIGFLIDRLLSEKIDEQKGVNGEEIESIKANLKKLLAREEETKKKYATKEEFQAFLQDNRKLLKSFLDFFIGYGLEMGKKSPNGELSEITSKLQGLEEELAKEDEGGEVKIKWK